MMDPDVGISVATSNEIVRTYETAPTTLDEEVIEGVGITPAVNPEISESPVTIGAPVVTQPV